LLRAELESEALAPLRAKAQALYATLTGPFGT